MKKGAREGESGSWAYTNQGSPAKLQAPLVPGEYELRYALGQSYATLVSAPITITPAKEEPGQVRVEVTSAGDWQRGRDHLRRVGQHAPEAR